MVNDLTNQIPQVAGVEMRNKWVLWIRTILNQSFGGLEWGLE